VSVQQCMPLNLLSGNASAATNIRCYPHTFRWFGHPVHVGRPHTIVMRCLHSVCTVSTCCQQVATRQQVLRVSKPPPAHQRLDDSVDSGRICTDSLAHCTDGPTQQWPPASNCTARMVQSSQHALNDGCAACCSLAQGCCCC
jgi:hypothetical protein